MAFDFALNNYQATWHHYQDCLTKLRIENKSTSFQILPLIRGFCHLMSQRQV